MTMWIIKWKKRFLKFKVNYADDCRWRLKKKKIKFSMKNKWWLEIPQNWDSWKYNNTTASKSEIFNSYTEFMYDEHRSWATIASKFCSWYARGQFPRSFHCSTYSNVAKCGKVKEQKWSRKLSNRGKLIRFDPF